MDLKIKSSGIKPNRQSSPIFFTVSQRQRWLEAAQAIAQLLKLYLGDPDLVFTESDFSCIWAIEQFGQSDFKGILTQLRHISSLEFWREFPEFVEFLFAECSLQSKTLALFCSLYELHPTMPEPIRRTIPVN